MTITIAELQGDLNNAIDNLRDSFENFDFLTKNILTLSDLEEIEGFEKFAVEDSELIEFKDFKRKIVKSLYCLDETVKITEFDWDAVEILYDEVEGQYRQYQEVNEQLEEFITEEQDVNLIELKSEEDMKQALLDYAISNNLINEILKEGTTYYLVNSDFQKNIVD